MRVGIKTALVAVIIAVVCLIIAAILIKPHVKRGDKYLAPPFRRGLDSNEGLTLPKGNWPMFRGEQRLLGRASGSLPGKLRLVWKFKTEGSVKSSPVIGDGLVFVGSSDANIYAIDLKDGRQLWAYTTGGAVEAAPCLIESTVFTGSSDNFLYAIDAKTGKLQWKYHTDGKILGSANWTRPGGSVKTESFGDGHLNINTEPNHPQAALEDATHQNVWILVGSYDNKLHCVDSATGKAVWTYETQNYINGSPAVEGRGTSDSSFAVAPDKSGPLRRMDEGRATSIAVFGGCDAMIHVISLTDSKEIAGIDTGSFIAASPALLRGRVYVGNYDGVFICADISKGKIIWKFTAGDSPIFSSPAVGEDVVIFGGRDKRVHCLRREDGKPLWEFVTLDEVDSSPVICGDKVVVGSEDGRLYMLELSKGKLVWSYEIGEAITSSPAVAYGMVVIGCDDGFIYAFGAENSK